MLLSIHELATHLHGTCALKIAWHIAVVPLWRGSFGNGLASTISPRADSVVAGATEIVP
jgi:hypothetical protein